MTARDLLGSAAFERVFERARKRLEREPGALASARTSLSDPSAQERAAIEGLVGRRFRGTRITVSLQELDERLREGTGDGLVAWLERIHGRPLRNRPEEEASLAARRAAALAELDEHRFAEQDWFHQWVEAVRGRRLTRLLTTDDVDALRLAAKVLAVLPANSEAMPVFASREAGGTKALRRGTRAGRLVLRGLAFRAGVPMPEGQIAERDLWEQFGVYLDDLSVSALALNLPAVGDGVVDRTLRDAAGIPVRITLHQLVKHAPTLDRRVPVFVCENPAIVRMAAERLGPRSAPLIATEGHAVSAFWKLLALVGDDVRARADFDADGLRIAGKLIERGASPWRFDAATYRAFAGENARLPAELPESPWDPALREAMRGGVRVEEEELLDALIEDLA